MTETVEVVGAFPYPDAMTAALCEDKAARIEQINSVLVRVNVEGILEMGRCLNAVRQQLSGQYEQWLAWRLPWCRETARRWRVLAQRVDCLDEGECQKFLALLNHFRSTTAAIEFAGLPEPVQRAVVEAEAWSWNEFRAVCWRCKMDEHLEDGGLDWAKRHGDVLHAIEDVLGDEEAPESLREVAQQMYEAHRDTFARLEGEDPAVVDVEVGIRRREPTGDRPGAQLVETDEGYWLCRRITVNGREEFLPIAPVASHVLLWNGASQPSVMAAFPVVVNDATLSSWQRAFRDAGCLRVGASTLASVYGEVL